MPEIFNPSSELDKADKLFTQEAMDNLKMSNEEILQKIFRVSLNTLRTGDGSTRIGYTIANFSSLLVNLARQTEESTNKTIQLTKQIYYLTWFIAILTAVLLFASFFDFPKISMLRAKGTPIRI